MLEFLKMSKISRATVWLDADGFGKSGKSTVHLEERLKIESLFPHIKKWSDDRGLMTIHRYM